MPQRFFSTEQGTVAGRDAIIPIVSESADPEGRKMAQLLSEDVMFLTPHVACVTIY